MSTYLCVDGGTTNTRVHLMRRGVLLDTVRISLGARAGISDKDALRLALREQIPVLLHRNSLTETDVRCILASGMLTSEFGLYPVAHISAPAGIAELHHAMVRVELDDITPIPFVFIPGVRIAGESYRDTDMMRGEETELAGIDECGPNCVCVLPGSHAKVIRTDGQGRIAYFSTLLSGEMAAALSEHTILRDAVDLACPILNEEYLLQGCEDARQFGLNRTLFKTRVLKNQFSCAPEETYSYFLGAVLEGDVSEILRYEAETVILGGRASLRKALAVLLGKLSECRVMTLDDETVDHSCARGMVRVYEYAPTL